MSISAKVGPRECDERHVERTRRKFDALIGPLREVAREHGYALAVHGSLSFDIDLVAAPWVEECSDARTLAEAIQAKAREINGYAGNIDVENAVAVVMTDHFRDGKPGEKPHGRLCWTFHLGGGPYLDLSVMPAKAREE